MSKQNGKERSITPVLSLDDLSTMQVNVEIELLNGDILAVPIKTLTYREWLEIGWEVPAPTPPISGVDASKRPVFNHNDPGYLANLERVNMERNYRRLLRALQIPIPGNTVDEQLDALKSKLDGAICRQLLNAINETGMAGEARIAARAESFRAGKAVDTEGVPGERVDAEPVESAV